MELVQLAFLQLLRKTSDLGVAQAMQLALFVVAERDCVSFWEEQPPHSVLTIALVLQFLFQHFTDKRHQIQVFNVLPVHASLLGLVVLKSPVLKLFEKIPELAYLAFHFDVL